MESFTYANLEPFQNQIEELLPNGKYLAKIVKVYDGDTVWAGIIHNGRSFRTKLRLRNINAAEIRGGTDETKASAQHAKKVVADLIADDIVHIQITGLDKWGRHLAFIYPNESRWKSVYQLSDYEYLILISKTPHYENNAELNHYMIMTGSAEPYMYKK